MQATAHAAAARSDAGVLSVRWSVYYASQGVDARHQHVEHNRIGRTLVQRAEGLVPVGGDQHVVPVQAQGALDGLAHGGLVVDDEDAHRGSA